MESFYIFQGLVLGFSIAAPVGPIGLLCIRHTITHGLLTGFFFGLGTACADAIYGLIAAFGLSVVSTLLLNNQAILHLGGGVFLLYLGLTTYKSSPTKPVATAHLNGYFTSYTVAFFLTLTNPMTILSFAAVFAGIGTPGGTLGSFSLVIGVFWGSILWWLLLSCTVNFLRTKINYDKLRWVNQLAGIIIAAFGVLTLMSV